jgi:hypothetical protein
LKSSLASDIIIVEKYKTIGMIVNHQELLKFHKQCNYELQDEIYENCLRIFNEGFWS